MTNSRNASSCPGEILKLAVFFGLLFTCAVSYAQKLANAGLFQRNEFSNVKLRGLQVSLGRPVEVTAQIAWHLRWPRHNVWSFVNLTPIMARFPDGNLIVTYTLDPDTQANPVFVSGFQISKDGGKDWGRRYSLIMQHIPMIFIPQPDDSLMALPSELMGQTRGDDRNFHGPLYRFEQGGKRLVVELDGVHVVDWPWPVAIIPGTQPRLNWHYAFIFTGSCMKIDGQLVATVYWRKKGQSLYNLALAASEDGGHTWHYYSTVATPDDVLPRSEWDRVKGFEGADESSIVRLADGKLMAVFRVGSGIRWKLRRAYSADNGRTWSKPKPIPAYSVEPEMVRTANGVVVLATGRPGIHLWFSTGGRGRIWQDVNIVSYHNKWAPNAKYRISPLNPNRPEAMWQTSSYTGLVQVAPNRLLLVYDRCPEEAPAGPEDLSRVFVMPITVKRK